MLKQRTPNHADTPVSITKHYLLLCLHFWSNWKRPWNAELNYNQAAFILKILEQHVNPQSTFLLVVPTVSGSIMRGRALPGSRFGFGRQTLSASNIRLQNFLLWLDQVTLIHCLCCIRPILPVLRLFCVFPSRDQHLSCSSARSIKVYHLFPYNLLACWIWIPS